MPRIVTEKTCLSKKFFICIFPGYLCEQRIFFGGKSQEYRVVVGARYAGWIILKLLIITVEINISTAGNYNLIVKQIGVVSIVTQIVKKVPCMLVW